MPITPIISSVPSTANTQKAGTASKTEASPSVFEGLLKNAVQNANQSELEANMEAMKIASGQSDSLHTLAISSAKAELALSALVQMRNKALDAYNEIMRITL